MKANEIRDMTLEEMTNKEGELVRELFHLRFQHGVGQLENPRRIGEVRKDIARIQTIRGEMQRAENAPAQSISGDGK
jgi:large subunit ribosomal protein L29